MSSTTSRVIAIVVVFLAALTGALLLLNQSKDDAASGDGGGSGSMAASDIWDVGDAWTVQVSQDAGAVSPDGDENNAKIPFRFEVTDAPSGADGEWIVRVEQDGAEGPFKDGWRLHYTERDDALVLTQVAMADQKPLEAELAAIVLGSQFPYEVRYTAPPKDSTITATDLIERSSMPPAAAVPGSDAPGGGDMPTAPPIEDAVAPSSTPALPQR